MSPAAIDCLRKIKGDEDIPELVDLSETSASIAESESRATNNALDLDSNAFNVGGAGSSVELKCIPSGASECEKPVSARSGNESKPQRGEIHVRFGDIEWKEYGMILGDHPEPEGPALTIGWEPQDCKKDTVDHYEETRKPRRATEDLRVKPIVRKLYLGRCAGETAEEIATAVRKAQQYRRQRMETVRDLKNERLNIFFESAKRKTTRLLSKTIHPLMIASQAIGGGSTTVTTGGDRSDLLSKSPKSPPKSSRRSTLSGPLTSKYFQTGTLSSKNTSRRVVASFHGGITTGNHAP